MKKWLTLALLAVPAVLMLLVLSAPVSAKAPATSLLPELRPGSTSTPATARPVTPTPTPPTTEPPVQTPAQTPVQTPIQTSVQTTVPARTVRVIVNRSLLPTPRPASATTKPGVTAPVRTVRAMVGVPTPPVYAQISALAIARSLKPKKRPRNFARIVKAAVRTQPSNVTYSSKYGAICGDRAIRGKVIAPIPGRIRGCGISSPVKVYEVEGVRLSTPATINCTTAKALKKWIRNSVRPTIGNTGGGVASFKVVAHYACRTRNNRPGAKISEHGRGNAIDIAAIILRNGSVLSVLKGWRTRSHGKILKKIHAGACGPFGTVLGPNSDRYHQDHFHFDVARHRGGPYCR